MKASAAVTPESNNFPYAGQLRQTVMANLATLLLHLDTGQGPTEMGQPIDWTHDCLQRSPQQFRSRERTGCIRTELFHPRVR